MGIWEYFLQLTLAGLTKGSIYALLALGYTMVYGIVKLINFAHGEIYMLGAFTGLLTGTLLAIMWGLGGVPVFLLAILLASVYAAGYGFALERIAYRPLRNAPRLSALISAIGMSMFLQQYVAVAQSTSFYSFPVTILENVFPQEVRKYINGLQVFIFLTVGVVMLLLYFLIKHTKRGKAMRSVSQDKVMAQLLGINVDTTISFTFIVGSITAAIGGIAIGAYVGQVDFFIGFLAGVKAFAAAVLGGIGSIPGAVLGSFLLGIIESYGAGYISNEYEDAFAFLILVLFLLLKPTGVLGRKMNQKV